MNLFIVGPLTSGHIQQWYSRFDASQFDKILVFTAHNKAWDFIDNNVNVRLVNCGYTHSRFDFFILYSLVFIFSLRKKNVVLNCHFMSSYGLSSILARAKGKFLNCWGSDVNKLQYSRLRGCLYKVVLNKYDWINAPSSDIKSKLERYISNSSKVHVFQYGVDVEMMPVREEGKVVDKNKIKFVSNRNWQPLYNIDSIILGFSEFVETTGAKHELHVFGTGAPSDIERINNLVASMNNEISDLVFLHGFSEKSKMLEKMSSFDCFISFPDMDGLPLSLLESMYVGLLPLVLRLPAYEDWLSEDQTVFINSLKMNDIVRGFQDACEKIHTFTPMPHRKSVISHGDHKKNSKKFHDAILSISR